MLPKLLLVDDALSQITAAMRLTTAQDLYFNDAPAKTLVGRVTAAAIRAKLSHPPKDTSAMDGYAARIEDVASLPITLKQIGESAAGHPFTNPIGEGECVRIFTGAHCPVNTSVIILQEDTVNNNGFITINAASAEGQFIRRQGNDFAEGDMIVDTGAVLDARRIALIASAGHNKINLRRKPMVAVISTGDELVAAGVMPEDHQIVSSNGVFLSALLHAMGADVMPIGIVKDGGGKDEEDNLTKALLKASAADLIVTSGGASAGDHDGVARYMTATSQNNATLDFWRIAMRPGKPLIFGRINNTPLLGLPGNPVSTGVCAIIFVAAAIRTMLGQNSNQNSAMPPASIPTQKAVLDTPLPANDKRQDFLRASLSYDDQARLHTAVFNQQDSGMLSLFALADALVIRPPHAPPAKVGDLVDVVMIPPQI